MKNRHQRNKEKDHLARLNKEYRKKFFTNLKFVCNQLAGYDLYSKFTTESLEEIYQHRLRQVTIDADESQFPPKEFKAIVQLISDIINTTSVELLDGKGEVPLAIYLIEGATLIFRVKSYKGYEFPAAGEIKETLSRYLEQEHYQCFYSKIHYALLQLNFIESDFSKGFIWGQHKREFSKTKTALLNKFYVYKAAPVQEHFVVDGHSRPAFRVGWALPSGNFQWAEITPTKLGLRNSEDDLPMPVYIQSHALLRLDERMGTHPGFMHLAVFDSIMRSSCHHDDNGRILIDYIYLEQKTGYLVCSVENKKVLIHTFLFLTNNGTPEGKKLFELTGMQIMDKKYLAIDRLRTFLSYNIEDNEFVKNIFIQAGCGHLLDEELINQMMTRPTTHVSADIIANYLKTNLHNEVFKKSFSSGHRRNPD